MEIQELRIGNWITEPDNEDKNPFQVWGIYHELGNHKINNLPISHFQPIPLTDVYWLKLGFKWCLKPCTWSLGNITLVQWDGDEYRVGDDCGLSIKLNYVHELQNWYYWNSDKKELTIKTEDQPII